MFCKYAAAVHHRTTANLFLRRVKLHAPVKTGLARSVGSVTTTSNQRCFYSSSINNNKLQNDEAAAKEQQQQGSKYNETTSTSKTKLQEEAENNSPIISSKTQRKAWRSNLRKLALLFGIAYVFIAALELYIEYLEDKDLSKALQWRKQMVNYLVTQLHLHTSSSSTTTSDRSIVAEQQQEEANSVPLMVDPFTFGLIKYLFLQYAGEKEYMTVDDFYRFLTSEQFVSN